MEKIKEYKINNDDKNTHIFTEISGADYELVNYYFSDKNGFFEAFNHEGVNKDGEDLRGTARNDKAVFDRFYEILVGKNYYKLKPKYQTIIDSSSDTKNELKDLYIVLNKIPFGYDFYNTNKSIADNISKIIDPRGTYPFEIYSLDISSKAQKLTDEKIADYYERYTSAQYVNLNSFISYMNEKYGIPKTTFKYSLPNGINQKYGFYMYDTSITWENMKKKVMNSVEGIVSHRNSQNGGKMCPAPGFQIDRISTLK